MRKDKILGWLRGVTVAVSATALIGMAPGAAHADTGGTILPGWELPATVTVLPDGTMMADVVPSALQQLKGAKALATTGCLSACEGKNPGSYVYSGSTCATDAKTIKAVYEPGGTYAGVELRYSPRCRTAWARWTDNAQDMSTISLHSYNTNGTARQTYFADPYDHNNTGWTAMANDAGLLASACYFYYEHGSAADPYYTICTTKA